MGHIKRRIGLMVAAALALQTVLPVTGVYAKVSRPKLSAKSIEVKAGASKKVSVKNAGGYKMTVKSGNKKIVSVSKKGKTAFMVKGIREGKTIVTCTLEKKNSRRRKLTCTVRVTGKNNDSSTDRGQPTAVPTAEPTAVSTPEPTTVPLPAAPTQSLAPTPSPVIVSFPETDEFTDVPYGYADVKETVPKGTTEEITYKSKATNRVHKVTVRLPAGYSQDREYPVLYLIHGEEELGDDSADGSAEDAGSPWDILSAGQIIDNATAFKMAEEMIVVMPDVSGDNAEDIIKDFGSDLKPAVEEKYSVERDRCYNAVAGYGLGGRAALCIGLSLPEQVAYTGAFAPTEGVLPYDGGSGYFSDDADFGVREEYRENSFVMIQKGDSDDASGGAPETYRQALAKNGTRCLYVQMDGTHGSELFRAGLYNFVRRLFKRGGENEGIVNGFVTKVPTALDTPAKEKGRLEIIEYDTYTYDPDGKSVSIRKWANVYLPYDYDPDSDKPYNILYLMHGGGENADTWIKGDNKYGDYTHNQNMINLMFQERYCEPCIIVNPTFYRPSGAPDTSAENLTILFQHELRNDLIPAVEAKYSTYANKDVSEESLKASRMHRGFAGLSMGSMTTYQSAFYGNYDLFAWFAPYSGYSTIRDLDYDDEADKFVKIIEDGEENDMPLGFVYCGNGTKDIALGGHLEIMEKALVRSDKLVPGRNFSFMLIPDASHDMNQWHIHLYNTLQIFFTKE